MCTPLGKNIVDSFFWSYPFLFSALLLYLAARELTESHGLKRGHTDMESTDRQTGRKATLNEKFLTG